MNRVGRVVCLQLRNYHKKPGGSVNVGKNKKKEKIFSYNRIRAANPGLSNRMALLKEAGEDPFKLSEEEIEDLDETDADFNDAVDMHRIYVR